MECERCRHNPASVHVTRKSAVGSTIEKHFCENCAADIGLSDEMGESLLLFPWEEQGDGSFSFTGHVAELGEDAIVLRVLRCSHYPKGSKLKVPAAIMPKGMRKVGSEFSFNFPAEHIGAVIIASDTT
jgi:hypothetical protein